MRSNKHDKTYNHRQHTIAPVSLIGNAEDRAIIKAIEALSMTTQAVKPSPTASRRPRLSTPVSLRIAQPSIPRSEHLHRNPSKTTSPSHQPLAATRDVSLQACQLEVKQNSPRHSIVQRCDQRSDSAGTFRLSRQPANASPYRKKTTNNRIAFQILLSNHTGTRNRRCTLSNVKHLVQSPY